MQAFRIIVFSIIGLFLGIVFSILYTSGYFERWEKLSSPSTDISDKFSAVQQQDSFLIQITNPCDYSEPEFSILSNSPKNKIDCVQIKHNYPDGQSRETYVRDSNGNIWQWSYLSYFGFNEVVCLPGYGLIIGLVMAIATNQPAQIQKELAQK